MPGKLYKGTQQIPTPTLGAGLVNAMYLGDKYVGYNGQYSTFISASGGTITTDGDYKIHRFNSNDVFHIFSAPLSINNAFEILVVGGGAGGGCRVTTSGSVYTNLPGGGGGGAVVHIPLNANFRLNAGSYNVVVGAGGAGQVDGTPSSDSANGSPSYITSSAVEVYALGGFRPTYDPNTFTSQSSLSGVSGQYGHNFPNGDWQFGEGQYPGGGGAGEAGASIPSSTTCTPIIGVGGDGYQVTTLPYNKNTDNSTTDRWGAGGGGGRAANVSGCPPSFAPAAGGDGGAGGSGASLNGVANSGGGGGQSVAPGTAGNGGSGTVIIRYKYK